MDAIILVGGLGTRLGSLTRETPKPMLLIRNSPFLERLLVVLKSKGVSNVILAVGYKHEVIKSHFFKLNKNIPSITYSIENTPLGTGGAIAKAIKYTNSSNIFALNGDSYLDVNFKEMMQFHQEKNSDITIASCFVKPADRYGVMNVDRSGKVVNFLEKGIVNEGLINGGVYILNKKKFSTYFDSLNQLNFSFEELVLSNNDLGIKKYHFLTNGYFLDIGVPADYLKAQTDLFV